ncbi:MAG: hypothetical protein QM564_11070 [Bergeyella sp.]
MDTKDKNPAKSEFGKFTETEINQLKAQHGKRLRYFKVTTPDGDSEFIIKKPNRSVSSAVSEAFEKKDNNLASDIMIKNCVVYGDLQDIEDDAVVFTKVTVFITGLVNDAEIEAKKL